MTGPSIFPLWLSETAQDLRLALRRMQRAPAIAMAIVTTVGLGLGAAAAVFTASKAALLEPLPYSAPARLVHLWEVRVGTEERSPTSFATLVDWRSRTRSFSGLEGYDPTNVTVGINGESHPVRGARVTPGFLRLLGVTPAAGRDFAIDELAVSGGSVAIVSERLARSSAVAAPGETITINGTSHLIVGVLPHSFHFALLQNADIFVPLVASGQSSTSRADRSIQVIGRLRDGASLPRSRADLAAAMSTLADEHPEELAGRTVLAMPLRDALLGKMKLILNGLLLAVALLLLIMAANLALLMLTRYVARAPELAMRYALGATRSRVLRQLLAESLVPSLAGAALAAVVGQTTTRILLEAIPDVIRSDMPYLTDVGLDRGVVTVIFAIAVMMAIGFGLGPALFVTKTRGTDSRNTAARGDRRLRRGLVAAQISLAFVLLVSSALLVVSFSKLVRRDLGFRDPGTLVAVRVPLSGQRYATPLAQRQFYGALLTGAGTVPGVQDAALINEVPGGGGGFASVDPVDRGSPSSAAKPRAALRIIGGAYFRTMGIPIVAGRAFEASDRSDTPPVAVVSASFARMLATDGTTLGRQLRLAGTGATQWEVIGVAGDVQVAALDADLPPVIYLSHLQADENRMTLVLRTTGTVASTASQFEAIVRRLDPGVPVYSAARLDHQLSESKAIFNRRFPMILCAVFAAAALALTLIALYAICTHEVLTRRREFGIRLALGSSPDSVRRLILNDALLLGIVGVGIGSIVATVISRSMQAVLFGIAPTDWRVYGAVGLSVLACALLASLRPALRAGSVNPSVVMRAE